MDFHTRSDNFKNTSSFASLYNTRNVSYVTLKLWILCFSCFKNAKKYKRYSSSLFIFSYFFLKVSKHIYYSKEPLYTDSGDCERELILFYLSVIQYLFLSFCHQISFYLFCHQHVCLYGSYFSWLTHLTRLLVDCSRFHKYRKPS